MHIPLVMRKHGMKALHISHQGQVCTLRREHQTRYTGKTPRRTFVQGWRSASVAQNARPSSLTSRFLWKAIHLVLLKVLQLIFFCVEGKDFLVIMDKYSAWPVITLFQQHGVTSAHVIRAVKSMMMEKGVPVHSDECPQFASGEFSQFCEDCGITHVRSSPHQHQANGAAEAAVKAQKH